VQQRRCRRRPEGSPTHKVSGWWENLGAKVDLRVCLSTLVDHLTSGRLSRESFLTHPELVRAKRKIGLDLALKKQRQFESSDCGAVSSIFSHFPGKHLSFVFATFNSRSWLMVND
jgi:hypothetical protein